MAKQRNLLKNLRLREVSFVDDPASPGANVVLVKRRDAKHPGTIAKVLKAFGYPMGEGDDGAKSFNDALADARLRERMGKTMDAMWQAFCALQDSLTSIARDETVADKMPAMKESLGQFEAALEQIVPQLAVVKALAAGADEDELQTGGGSAAYFTKEIDRMSVDIEKLAADLESATAKIAAVEKRNAELTAENEQLKADVAKAKQPQPTEDEVLKNLPEPVRKRLEAAEAIAKASEAAVAKLRDDAETSEFIAKAKALDLPGVQADTFGPILKRVAKGKTTADDATEIERVLKALKEQAKTSALFKSAGVSGGADPEGAEAQLKKKADEIRKAEPTLTKEQAFAKAMDENPQLYADYVVEKRQARAAA